MEEIVSNFNREPGSGDVFWAEMTPCDHSVQIYDNDGEFLDALEAYVRLGLKAGEVVIVLATGPHLLGLEERLAAGGVDLLAAQETGSYITFDAEEVLSRFVEDGWPNEENFRETVHQILSRARMNRRRARVFGEMVAVLWGRGHNAATVRLEHLWHELCKELDFPLFCAYPNVGFTGYATNSLKEIRALHHRVLEVPA